MAAGFPLTREVIDNFSADRARQVQTALRGTYLALDKLARIATAQEVQAAPDDFLWNAKKLIGPHF